MANKKKAMSSIRDFLIKLKAVDELPEELAQDALEMTEAVSDALEEEENKIGVEEEVEEDEVPSEAKASEKAMEDAMTKVLLKYGVIKDAAMESLEEAEDECGITKDADGEEEITVDPEVINNKDSAKRNLIREVKPVIASIKDASVRKKLSDSFAKALRMSAETTKDYAAIDKIKKANSKDSAPSVSNDNDLGLEWAKKYNPHYKEG